MTGWCVETCSGLQAWGVKLVLLGGTMGLLYVTAVPPAPPAPRLETPPAHSTRAVRVNINHGSPAELETLPTIGPVLAERIVRYRRDHGHFASANELRRVKGIGVKRVKRLRPLIHVGDSRSLHRTEKTRVLTGGASERGTG